MDVYVKRKGKETKWLNRIGMRKKPLSDMAVRLRNPIYVIRNCLYYAWRMVQLREEVTCIRTNTPGVKAVNFKNLSEIQSII